MITTIVFDFDGLILDTELSAYQSWCEIYQEYDCDLPVEEWVACIGGTDDHFDPFLYLETKLGRKVPRQEIRTKRQKLHLEMLKSQPALPGVEDYLNEAKRMGLKLGVASNSPRTWVEGHLQQLGLLSFFSCVITGDQVLKHKPEPDLYLTALRRLDSKGEHAIAFEDSPHGVRAAQRAGMFCIAVPNQMTKHLSLEHADMHLISMAAKPLDSLLIEIEKRKQSASSSIV